jgi:hypothetical protein
VHVHLRYVKMIICSKFSWFRLTPPQKVTTDAFFCCIIAWRCGQSDRSKNWLHGWPVEICSGSRSWSRWAEVLQTEPCPNLP